jgi:hypothetical protein
LNNAVDRALSIFVFITIYGRTILIGIWPQIGTTIVVGERLRLIHIGKGNKPVTEARFMCEDCGEIVEKQVRPPVPTIGGSVSYISLSQT